MRMLLLPTHPTGTYRLLNGARSRYREEANTDGISRESGGRESSHAQRKAL